MATIFSNVKTERQMSASTGLSNLEFEELHKKYTVLESQLTRWQENTKGEALHLDSPRLRLFFILYYLRNYPPYDILGVHFDMDGSTAQRNVELIYPILEQVLASHQYLPIRKLEELAELTSALEGKKKLWETLLKDLRNALRNT